MPGVYTQIVGVSLDPTKPVPYQQFNIVTKIRNISANPCQVWVQSWWTKPSTGFVGYSVNISPSGGKSWVNPGDTVTFVAYNIIEEVTVTLELWTFVYDPVQQAWAGEERQLISMVPNVQIGGRFVSTDANAQRYDPKLKGYSTGIPTVNPGDGIGIKIEVQNTSSVTARLRIRPKFHTKFGDIDIDPVTASDVPANGSTTLEITMYVPALGDCSAEIACYLYAIVVDQEQQVDSKSYNWVQIRQKQGSYGFTLVDEYVNPSFSSYYKGTEKVVYTFSLLPEQIPGQRWFATVLSQRIIDKVKEGGETLMHCQLYENKQPTLTTDYELAIEYTLTSITGPTAAQAVSPQFAWVPLIPYLVIVGILVVLGIITIVTIKSIDHMWYGSGGTPSVPSIGDLISNVVVLMVLMMFMEMIFGGEKPVTKAVVGGVKKIGGAVYRGGKKLAEKVAEKRE